MPAPQLRPQGLNASFQHRLLLSLSERRRSSSRQQGFTLVELMIVVAIVGILAAVALPSYLKARDAAKIGARIGEAAAFAKECGVYKATEIGKPTFTGSGSATDGVTLTCALDADGEAVATWGTAAAEGVKCLDQTTTGTTAKATITVTNSSTSAQITCALS